MSKYNLSADAKSLSIELVVTAGNFKPQARSFYSPSISMNVDSIKFYESGVYKHAMKLNEIGTVGAGASPTTLAQAYHDIKNLIASIGAVI